MNNRKRNTGINIRVTPEEKRLFLFENAARLYGFKDLPDITPVMHMLD